VCTESIRVDQGGRRERETGGGDDDDIHPISSQTHPAPPPTLDSHTTNTGAWTAMQQQLRPTPQAEHAHAARARTYTTQIVLRAAAALRACAATTTFSSPTEHQCRPVLAGCAGVHHTHAGHPTPFTVADTGNISRRSSGDSTFERRSRAAASAATAEWMGKQADDTHYAAEQRTAQAAEGREARLRALLETQPTQPPPPPRKGDEERGEYRAPNTSTNAWWA
jgi:hypothetical protein